MKMHNLAFDLTVTHSHKDFVLLYGDKIIKSADGKHNIKHKNKKFLEAIQEEIQSFGEIKINDYGAIEPIFFSLYAIYSDHLSHNIKNDLIDKLNLYVFADITFVTNAGPEQTDQINASEPILNFLIDIAGESANIIHDIAHMVYFEVYSFMQPDEVIEMMKEDINNSEIPTNGNNIIDRVSFKNTKLYSILVDQLSSLTNEECAALHGLNAMNGDRHFLTSLAYISGYISKEQYSTCILSSSNLRHGTNEDVERSEYRQLFTDKLNETVIAQKFLQLTVDDYQGQAFNELKKEIKQKSESWLKDKVKINDHGNYFLDLDENEVLEFKETFEKDTRTGQMSKDIKSATIREIAGFLNTNTGTIIIGINDKSKEIIGIENDNFDGNKDRYDLKIMNLLKDRCGVTAASLVKIKYEEYFGSTICIIKCTKSNEPIYFRNKNNEEVPIVRSGSITSQPGYQEWDKFKKQYFKDTNSD